MEMSYLLPWCGSVSHVPHSPPLRIYHLTYYLLVSEAETALLLNYLITVQWD